jgi:hypothetical protein
LCRRRNSSLTYERFVGKFDGGIRCSRLMLWSLSRPSSSGSCVLMSDIWNGWRSVEIMSIILGIQSHLRSFQNSNSKTGQVLISIMNPFRVALCCDIQAYTLFPLATRNAKSIPSFSIVKACFAEMSPSNPVALNAH